MTVAVCRFVASEAANPPRRYSIALAWPSSRQATNHVPVEALVKRTGVIVDCEARIQCSRPFGREKNWPSGELQNTRNA